MFSQHQMLFQNLKHNVIFKSFLLINDIFILLLKKYKSFMFEFPLYIHGDMHLDHPNSSFK